MKAGIRGPHTCCLDFLMKEEARHSGDLGVACRGGVGGWRCGMVVEPPLPAACYQRSRHFKFQKVIRIYLFIPCPVPERISGSNVIGQSHHTASQGQNGNFLRSQAPSQRGTGHPRCPHALPLGSRSVIWRLHNRRAGKTNPFPKKKGGRPFPVPTLHSQSPERKGRRPKGQQGRL